MEVEVELEVGLEVVKLRWWSCDMVGLKVEL